MEEPRSDTSYSKTLRLSPNLHIGVKAKIALINLNRQGRLYSRLLQQGQETKLNYTETKGERVFELWDEVVEKY